MDPNPNDPGIALDAPAPTAAATPAPETPVEQPQQPLGSLTPKPAEAPDILKNIATARSNGVSWDEINNALADKRTEAKAQGVTDKEFNDALGLPQPKEGQQYFSFKDIADHAGRAFIDYPDAAWEA